MKQRAHENGRTVAQATAGRLLGNTVEVRFEVEEALGEQAQRQKRERLAEQARLLEMLSHPGLPRVQHVDLGLTAARQRRPSITLRQLKGVRLSEILDTIHGDHARGSMGQAGGRPWSLEGALNVFVRLVETVAFAHSHGVIHRAIDPSFVVVDSFGAVQVTDWHLARELSQPDLHDLRPSELPRGDLTTGPDKTRAWVRTRAGEKLGHSSFLAPEIRSGEQYLVGKSTDVYALGAILFQLLCGHEPGQGLSKRVRVRIAHHALSRIALRALAPQRQRRHSDAQELLAELEQALPNSTSARFSLLSSIGAWVDQRRLIAALLLLGAVFWIWHDTANGPPETQVQAALKQAIPRRANTGHKKPSIILDRPLKTSFGPALGKNSVAADRAEEAEFKSIGADPKVDRIQRRAGPVPSRSSRFPNPGYSQQIRRAVVARANGRWKEATALFADIYHAQVRDLGQGNAATLATRRELAACLAQSGDSQAALIHYYGCLELHQSPDEFSLDLQRELAALLMSRGEHEEGEQYLERAAKLAQEIYGNDSGLAADLIGQVASSAYRHGDLVHAAQAYERALEMWQNPSESNAQEDGQAKTRAYRTTLVQLYQRLDLPEQALRHAQALLETDSTEPSAQPARLALVRSLQARIDSH